MVDFAGGVRGFKMLAFFGAISVLASLFAVAPFIGAGAAEGDVVINEIYYNPPITDDADAEFLELYNPGATAIDLTGYTLDDSGSELAGTTLTLSGSLAANSYAIITPVGYDAMARWGVEPIAFAAFGLSGGGDSLTLRDSVGAIVDQLTYDDIAPWPTAADGAGPSAELIDSASDNSLGVSWAASVGGPTPGMVNSVTVTPPSEPISGVVATPFEPAVGEPITVVATVPGGGANPVLTYQINFDGELSVTMFDDGTNQDVTANDGVFTAVIPGQSAGDLVRYRIVAPTTGDTYPSIDARNYEGVVVDDPAEIPTGLVNMEWFIPEVDYNAMWADLAAKILIQGSVLAIDGVVYDNMAVKVRGGNFALENFDKQGLSFDFAGGVNLNRPDIVPYPIDEFALSAERGWTYGRTSSSWNLFYGAGFPEVSSQHVRVQRNGEFYGIFRFSEKLDGAWRDAAGITGDFYKAVIPGFADPATGFEKKQNDENQQPVIDFSNGVKLPDGPAKTDFLYEELDIPSAVNFLAVTNLIGNFDTANQNFYLHQDTLGTDLWQLYPWDLTNTFSNGNTPCGYGALEVSCRNNPLWKAIDAVPEFNEMVWRRMRTLIDSPMADGELEGLFDAYAPLVSSAEIVRDGQEWNESAYRTPAQINTEIDLRRGFFLNDSRLPASQGAGSGIVINELTHSPASGPEFLELHNPTSQSVDLSGWTIDNAGATLPGGTVMLPGDYLILTDNIPAYQAEYPSAPNVVLVQYDGGLRGGGELLELSTASGTVVDSVDYSNIPPWPTEPNAGTVTLSLTDPALDNAVASSWGISDGPGTPGALNDTVPSVPPVLPALVINEVHYNPAAGGVEFVEIRSLEPGVVNVEGYDLDGMITFPPGTEIDADGYLVATANLAVFQTLYPGVAAIEWVAGQTLNNGGEGLDLVTAAAVVVDDIDYGSVAPWPTTPNGGGPSLELTDPTLDNNLPGSWQASGTSGAAGGTPGAENVFVVPSECNGLTPTIDLNVTPGAVATGGADVILGTPGADVISGLGGGDTICGLGGDDTIAGNGGDDTILGGDGADTIYGGPDADTIRGGAGDDIIQGNGGVDVLDGDAGEDTLSGNDGDDTLNGGPDNDTLYGVAGVDTINGDGGADTILGGLDDDIINGGDGDDLISGNAGADTINGDGDNDTLYGSTEGDTINGGPGLDIILGGTGDDELNGGDDRDLISGNEDNDTIDGGAGNDDLFGVTGNDTLTGGAGLDIILGGPNDDLIEAIDGEVDQVSGNAGVDTCNADTGPGVIDAVFQCELP
ncbi:MAG: lamin tail domain-containing protein [Acidimicrobiia bacterium]|nr:lamin tail domain-containing protein [Acidimicrobiia bacterium]